MFFNISKNLDISFPNSQNFGSFVINHDNGWTVCDEFMYKGYIDNGVLSIKSKDQIDDHLNLDGNFCIIKYDNQKLHVISGRRQKFPIFQKESDLSNLYKSEIIHEGNLIISGEDIFAQPQKKFEFKNLKLTDDEIFKKIDILIDNKIKNFRTTEPLKIFITGGLDSILLTAYVLKNKIPYKLINCEHAEMDHFTCFHRNYIIKNFWAYSTIQHWKTDSILLSGSHGDGAMLRSSIQAKLIFDFHKDDLIELIKTNNSFYHSFHFLKDDNLKNYASIKNLKFNNIVDLKNYIIDRFSRDYQHWHLGNTLFFSPLNDSELLNLFLNFSYETMKFQLLDGAISKKLIEMNRPGLLKLLSVYKNHNYFEKTADLYEGKINLETL